MNRSPLLLPALLLAACAPATGPINTSVASVKVPRIATTQLVMDLRFDAANRLGAAQAATLEEYLASIRVGYGDRLALDDRGTGAEDRREAVEEVVKRFGLFVGDSAPVTQGAAAPGTVRLVITRSTATVDLCPDWRRTSNYDPHLSTMSNYGCATRGNMAAMIADPNDFVAGKSSDGGDGAIAAKAVKAYRGRSPTGTAPAAAPSPSAPMPSAAGSPKP